MRYQTLHEEGSTAAAPPPKLVPLQMAPLCRLAVWWSGRQQQRQLFGSLVARSLVLGDGASLHFDESLRYDTDDEVLGLETLLWRPISADVDLVAGTPGP